MNTMESSITRMIAVTLIGCLALTSMASAAQEWHAWGVFNETASVSGSDISFVQGETTTDYRWEDPAGSGTPGSSRDGIKTFYSTDYFNGLKLSAIESVAFDTSAQANNVPYVNVYVSTEYQGNTEHAILAVEGDMRGDWDQKSFAVWEETNSDAFYNATSGNRNVAWNDLKDMTISAGGYNGHRRPSESTDNSTFGWDSWDGDADAIQDGFALVWGSSSGSYGTNPTTTISNLSVVPEPATMSLLGLGGLAILRRRRRSRK